MKTFDLYKKSLKNDEYVLLYKICFYINKNK